MTKEDFMKLCSASIRGGDFFPGQLVFVDQKDVMTVCALAGGAKMSFDVLQKYVNREDVKKVFFAIDRYSKEGQGFSTESFISIYVYEHKVGWISGCIEYTKEDKVVNEEWAHYFTNNIMQLELTSHNIFNRHQR